MSQQNGKSGFTSTAIAIVAVIFGVMALFGVQGKVSSLETQVAQLEGRFAILDQRVEGLNRIERKLDQLQSDVTRIQRFRDEIIQEIRKVVEP